MKEALVAVLPKCDICGKPAEYDARIPFQGCWANLCEHHFKEFGCSLGTGCGQKLKEVTK